jgi:hypothetical protein
MIRSETLGAGQPFGSTWMNAEIGKDISDIDPSRRVIPCWTHRDNGRETAAHKG